MLTRVVGVLQLRKEDERRRRKDNEKKIEIRIEGNLGEKTLGLSVLRVSEVVVLDSPLDECVTLFKAPRRISLVTC